jgi:energy-coupling factor transport system permease protein
VARDLTLGQYYPVESFVHKLDPRIKFIIMTVYIVGVFLVKHIYGFAVVAAFAILSTLISRVPILSVLKSLKGIIFIVIFTAVLNVFFHTEGKVYFTIGKLLITEGGVFFALKMALRLILLVLGTTLLTYTTTPMALTDGLERLMTPLTWIKIPVHDIAIIMSISLRFIPILMEEVQKIMKAQRARGAEFDRGGLVKRAKALLPILIPLFISEFRRADELALALDARCYNATPNRTRYKKLKMHYRDFIAFLAGAAYIVLIVAVNNKFWIPTLTYSFPFI